MIRFILQRLLHGLIVIVAVISITFIIIRLAPGSPFARDREMTPHQVENLEKLYGLDQPLVVQLGKNLWNFATFQFPVSMKLKEWTVGDIIAQGLPVSLTVGVAAFLIAISIGIPAGALAAMRAGRFQDRATMAAATLGICVPSLVLGPLIAMLFGLKLHWFNTAGW